ncbi:MAG: lycopene cyclase domain-containing protein [Actinobacteria bacterium HGW-Actinobacteria-4]|nr:MAG: lycopene cyclase domain-containing protein [Actinobacteria bacterium HGW-Actinobacteria-4]
MTYVALSVAVLAVLGILTWRVLSGLPTKPLLLTLAVLVVLTAVFDNIIVGVGLVDYDPALISGIRVPIAPIEDFAYTVGAVMIVPALWTWLGRRQRRAALARAGGSES